MEFIPQVLFLLGLFGWLVFMIVYKWCIHYENPNTVREGGGREGEADWVGVWVGGWVREGLVGWYSEGGVGG